jgi:ArsR family transcriptional regulator, arsenate/arsenite/antimonite-responsive transcriptional repressor
MNELLTSIKSVSEEIRVRILLLLLDREACVCELMEVFEMAQSKLSHHLIILRDAGLLQDDKRGKWNYYKVNTKSLNPVNRELVLSLSKWSINDDIIQKDKRTLEAVKKKMQICC